MTEGSEINGVSGQLASGAERSLDFLDPGLRDEIVGIDRLSDFITRLLANMDKTIEPALRSLPEPELPPAWEDTATTKR